MIEPMAKARLASPRNLVGQVTALLQEAGVLHIESEPAEAVRIPLRPQVMDEEARERQGQLQSLREELHRLLLLLPEVSAGVRPDRERARPVELDENAIARLTLLLRQVGTRVNYLSARLKACEDELASLAKYEQAIEALSPFLRLIRESEDLDYLGVTIEEPERGGPVLPLLHEVMAKVTHHRYELFHARLDARTLAILLVFPKTYTARIRALLWEEGINELQLPASVSDKPLGRALRIMLKKKVDLPLRARRLRDELANQARRRRAELVRYHEAVTRRLEQIEAETLFYQTEMASFVYGWIPRALVPLLTAKLEKTFGGKVVLEECPITRAELGAVPVVLRNPPYLRPFETFTRLVALPRYGSIDPTPYLAVFFPLFYGVILGDVGYGLLIVLTAFIVRRKYGQHAIVRDLTTIFFAAAAAAILFGFIYGELFGELGEWIGLHPILNRMEAFLPLLYLSVGLGTLHVSLGISLGALGAWREGARKECVGRLGGLLLVISFVGIMMALSGLIPREWSSHGIVGLLLSLLLLFSFGGMRGAMELHNIVNILSYLRLMGIGVASAALAFAANKLGGLVGNLFLAFVIAGTLHAINLIFGLFSPTIQSLRLHYVEFFENFFVAGGRPYRPFSRPPQAAR